MKENCTTIILKDQIYTKNLATSGIEPKHTDHETVMQPIHHITIFSTINGIICLLFFIRQIILIIDLVYIFYIED